MVFLNLVIFAYFVSFTLSWECGGTRDDLHFGPPNKRNLLARSSNLAPIRVTPFYLDFELSTPENTTFFKDVLFTSVNNFFRRSIKVYSINNNIIPINSQCNGFEYPYEHQILGVQDTDLIVYIKSEISGNAEYVAYAGACQIDSSGRNNPIIGIVMINDYYFRNYNFWEMYSILLHEIFHILGFSNNLYSFWKDETGSPYSQPVETRSIRGQYKEVLTTPNIVLKAREAFNCLNLTGVELEDYGSSGTAGSHWDKRIMYNDFMIGHVTSEAIYSTISLALLKDTGWYEVDYSTADIPLFGRDIGCSYFNKSCSSFYYSTNLFCQEIGKTGCDVFSTSKSICLTDYFADYCHYKTAFYNGNCRNSDTWKTMTVEGSHEVIGQNSHCLVGSLNEFKNLTETSRCYEVIHCNDSAAIVKIGSKELSCPFTGGTFEVEGFFGSVTCPASKILCQGFPCLEGCRGVGKCENGVCLCDHGYSGYACQIKCGDLCKTCDGSFCLSCLDENSEVNGMVCQCKQGFVKMENVCVECLTNECDTCISGYYFNDGECFKICSSSCQECLSIEVCRRCFVGFYISSHACLPCPEFCDKCIDGKKCVTCSKGYVLGGPFKCEIECPANCDTCSTHSNCLSCKPRYALKNGNCLERCPKNCLFCSSTTVCLECESAYILKNNVCKRFCSKNCEICSNPSTCTKCEDDYFISNSGYCLISCPYYCLTCNSSRKCLVCDSYFYVKNGECFSCSEGCLRCSSSKKCLECDSFYYRSGNKCVTCSDENCVRCNRRTCFLCRYGYYLVNGKCEEI